MYGDTLQVQKGNVPVDVKARQSIVSAYRSTKLEVLYIDDLVEGMFDLLEGKEQHCEFDGVETMLAADGR